MVIENYQFQSDFFRRQIRASEAEGEARGKARGEARGMAEALLTVIEARDIEVPDRVRAEIAACTDSRLLDTWIRRAAAAHRIQDVDNRFAGDSSSP